MTKKRSETSLQPKVLEYMLAKGVYYHVETKTTRGANRFYFRNFEEHQLDSLKALQDNGLMIKLSDEDSRLKPCDIVWIPPGTPGMVAIHFPSDKIYFVKVDYIIWLNSNDIKSMTESEAEKNAVHTLIVA